VRKKADNKACIPVADRIESLSLDVQYVFVISKVQKSRPHKPSTTASAVFLCAKTEFPPTRSA